MSRREMEGCEPLEEKMIPITDNGVCRKVKALSTHFVTQRKLVYFCAPPRPDKFGRFVIGAKTNWIKQANALKEDLLWLLSLPHHKFWSQVVFNKETWGLVTSFLQEAYPFYCLDLLPDDFSIQEAYYTIYSLVFCVLTRVTTQKESKDEWIKEKELGHLLYDNCLISLPLLYDIGVVYGSDNEGLVREMFSTVFSIQPLYKSDVDNSVQHLKCAMNTIKERFLKGRHESGDPVQLEEKEKFSETAKSFALGDIIYYLLDIAVSLRNFLHFYKEGPIIYHKHRVEYCISVLYETTVPELATLIKSSTNQENEMNTYFDHMLKLNQARYYLIEIFRVCLEHLLDDVDINKGVLTEAEAKENVYNFIDSLEECSTEKSFMEDYLKKYPMSQDLQKIIQICPDLDPFKYTFLSDLVVECKVPFSLYDTQEKDLAGAAFMSSEAIPSTSMDFSTQHNEGATSLRHPSTPNDLSSLISEVKEIFPDLGDGFIKACLEHEQFLHSSSLVINALLEGTLPQSLSSLDTKMPYIPPEEGPTGELYHRVNVFDNDEFDVMTRDTIDKSKIHKGKRKEKYKDLTQMMDDKRFREDLRDQFSKLGIVQDDEGDYNDEYDDTYDDVDVTVDEAGETEVMKPSLEPLNIKRGRRKLWTEEEADEEDDTAGETRRRGGFVPFAENPEDVRERYAARRAAMRGRGGQGRGGREPQGEPRQRDLVGNARGRGQSNEVLRNRQNKEANKSSRANHNRKNMSSFKRRTGLVPS